MRDSRYDILKGIAIIMMVAFHARAPQIISHFGYLFHMPVFFILAGWFFRSEYAENALNCIRFAKKKFARLWWPSFFWGAIFVLLHNQLLDWRLISTLDIDVPVVTSYRPPYWTHFEFVQNLFGVPLLQGDVSQLAGAFWFLRSLLFASIGYCTISWLCNIAKIKLIVGQSIIAIFFLFASKHLQLPLIGLIGGEPTLTAYALIHCGVLLHYFDLRIERLRRRHITVITIACFIILIGLASIGKISLAANQFNNCAYLTICALTGWYFLLGTSSLLPPKASVVLAYVGSRTMPILLFHFLSFKIVNAIGVKLCGLPSCRIADFPVTLTGSGWSIIYTLTGISVPLSLDGLYQKGRGLIDNTIRRLYSK